MDLEQILNFFDIKGIITTIVGGIAVAILIWALNRKRPVLKIKIEKADYYKRKDTSIVTTFSVFMLPHNKGKASTTIYSTTLEVTYKGKKYPVKGEDLNHIIEPGASPRKQLEFQLPIKDVVIEDDVEKVTLEASQTSGKKVRATYGPVKKRVT